MLKTSEFYRDVVAGLTSTPKTLPPKYFYDARGSQLFDAICQLPEYYPYRTELALLPKVAQDINTLFADSSSPVSVIEFGAGSLHKIQPLLQHIEAIEQFVAIDISGEHLASASNDLSASFPTLDIQTVVADFTKPTKLKPGEYLRMGFFPGSTIGNLSPQQAVDFLSNARQTLGSGSYMLLGVDTKKDAQLLHQAYNDSQGVTAAFNLNLLRRINRELGADFVLENFAHHAFYNEAAGRIEMHLQSTCAQQVSLDEHHFDFARNETIHTENSYKYTRDEFEALCQSAGWQPQNWWAAEQDMFATLLLKC